MDPLVGDGLSRVYHLVTFPRLFSIRLHHIIKPDSTPWPHDHSWAFLSIVLRGGYVEECATRAQFVAVDGRWVPARVRLVTRWNYKRKTDLHRVTELLHPAGVWTLCITGRRHPQWGFMTDRGWVAGGSVAVTPADGGVGAV